MNHNLLLPIALALSISILFHSVSLSQNLASIQGKVLDARTKEALPWASVYLAKTAIGSATKVDGTFLLDKISNGKYDLTASMVGYQVFTKPVVLDGHPVNDIVIYLVQEDIRLNTVEIKVKRLGNNNDFLTFKKYFLGLTLNSTKCDLTNNHKINITNKDATLFANSTIPVEVVNHALGYRVFYVLKEFLLNKENLTLRVSGIPRFEDLVPENKKQAARWSRERDRAYYGSMEHFIRSLKQRELKKNNFILYDSDSKRINEEDLLKHAGDSVIRYKGKITLEFAGELTESSYSTKREIQKSILTFRGLGVTIYENGIYEPYDNILLEGYLGWSYGMAELLPLGYQPTSKIK